MKQLFLGMLVLLSLATLTAQVSVQHLRCENRENPIGLDVSEPRFTWQLQSPSRNVLQTAYEIRLGKDAAALVKGKKVLWTTGKILSDQSVLVPYAGRMPLESNEKYHWQVRVWDNQGKTSAWSAPASFQMALLKPEDWKAQWIEPGFVEDSTRPSPIFRKVFTVNKKIAAATAHITAHGLYEAHLNGKRVGDAYLTPGWTSYNKRLQYQTYDVTDLLKTGANAVGVMLGSGWYRGILGWETNKGIYGKDIALLFQLDITYADGSKAQIVSDGSWKSSTGAVRYAEIYHGETMDARLDKTGWLLPDYKDQDWSGVKVADYAKNTLLATYNEPIKKHEIFKVSKILTTPNGEKVLDFGQNLVGWVTVKVRGNAGDTIRLLHSEVLDKAGNFYTESLRAARQQNIYVLKGGGEEVFEPHFTWQGFRYVKIAAYPGEIKPENFTAVALYSDMQPTGSFASSNPLLNQLQHNIQWGQRGNFLDVPTDCPQRDERLGWTGDAQAFSRTATFNFGVHNFFAKWLKDVAADQNPDGGVPFVVPNVLGAGAASSAGWADAATIIPWNMYMAYGDARILENQYESMKAWVGYMEKNSTDYLWNKGFHFGDWLFYRPFDDNDGRSAITDKYLIAQCFFAHSTQLMIHTAEVLGKKDDVGKYKTLLQNIKDAFFKEYVTPSGRLVSSSQTAYVLALNFDMLPDNLRTQAAERLVENIKSYDNHLTTGFLGTPYLCHVLTRFGYTDMAYKLLLQETYPSWLYPVKMGATTIWERWDGIKPDGSFQTPGMNSFNHYAYGAIGDWMYRTVAGLQEATPGYKQIKIQPQLGGGLSQAEATLETYYGRVKSGWQWQNEQLNMTIEIPANTVATVYLPTNDENAITENGKTLKEAGIKVEMINGNNVLIKLGSGKYNFVINGIEKI
ncbi:MAG: family 78 glycoside hydrolase catalytic domain [Saprospiraceae bacterium]